MNRPVDDARTAVSTFADEYELSGELADDVRLPDTGRYIGVLQAASDGEAVIRDVTIDDWDDFSNFVRAELAWLNARREDHGDRSSGE